MQKPGTPYKLQDLKRRRRGPGCLPLIGVALALLLFAYLIYQIPLVNDRLAWRVNDLRTRVVYYFNPPDQAIFDPDQSGEVLPTRTPTLEASPTAIPLESATPTATEAPLPAEVTLDGVVYVDQHNRWNYCAPANLTMALNFWGWEGDRDDVARVIKPGVSDPGLTFVEQGFWDKNVMPYEMEAFVDEQVPGLQAATRIGGEIDVLRRLIAAGFPVVVEKGYYEEDYTGAYGWFGHYLFVTGYNDAEGYFIVQDAYLETGEDGTGANLRVPYTDFRNEWRSFNYLFMVVYPEARLDEVIAILGPWNDPVWANQHALEMAQAEAQSLSGIDQYFAQFNVGASHVELMQYVDAAYAFDEAFALYEDLGGNNTQRPYRIMWYRTDPYWAYFYSGAYQRVIDLANSILYNTISEPTLEESLYWRGQAYRAIGQLGDAEADFRETIRLNPNFTPGYEALAAMGLTP